MKLFIQNVAWATINIQENENKPNELITHEISQGIIIYFWVAKGDNEDYITRIDKFVDKLTRLKFLKDEDGELTSTLENIQGEILIVSNFTLYANHRNWTKMDFSPSARYNEAKPIYHYFVEKMKENFGEKKIKTGIFGAMMNIKSEVIGPVNYSIEI